ncbi:MAG: DUF5130 family protein [Acidimicrobiales bacterium]|nr:DUF5130 family protein [Acidimicrobiales bacterium]
MATGDLARPTRRQRRRIDTAVEQAEASTGLQLCVFLGAPEGRDPHDHAEAVFVEAGLVERPAVLLLVAPKQHRVEVITGPHVRDRISNDDAAQAVAAMTEAFRRGDLTGGLLAGIEHLAASAGPGVAEAGAADIANIFDPD